MELNKENLLGFINSAEQLEPMVGGKGQLQISTEEESPGDAPLPTEEDIFGEPQPEVGPSPSTQQDTEELSTEEESTEEESPVIIYQGPGAGQITRY